MLETSYVGLRKRPSGLRLLTSLGISGVVHSCAAVLGLFMTVWTIHFPLDPPRQLATYSVSETPPPPPPPPPPPAAPTITPVQPTPVEPHEDFVPEVIPDSIPSLPSEGVEGGIEGGVAGGVVGGETGGDLGGVVGSVAAEPPPPPPPPPKQPDGLLVLERDQKLPVANLNQVSPVYPETLRKGMIVGWVVVHYHIDKRGRVRHPRIVRADHELFNRSALDAVAQWQFEPYRVDGKPAEIEHEITVIYQIAGRQGPNVQPLPSAGGSPSGAAGIEN